MRGLFCPVLGMGTNSPERGGGVNLTAPASLDDLNACLGRVF
ncbi:MAG: hypothetical protein ACJATG_001911, partial [Dinoroseobacter sp.]